MGDTWAVGGAAWGVVGTGERGKGQRIRGGEFSRQ